jgi:hypothetical protein
LRGFQKDQTSTPTLRASSPSLISSRDDGGLTYRSQRETLIAVVPNSAPNSD